MCCCFWGEWVGRKSLNVFNMILAASSHKHLCILVHSCKWVWYINGKAGMSANSRRAYLQIRSMKPSRYDLVGGFNPSEKY